MNRVQRRNIRDVAIVGVMLLLVVLAVFVPPTEDEMPPRTMTVSNAQRVTTIASSINNEGRFIDPHSFLSELKGSLRDEHLKSYNPNRAELRLVAPSFKVEPKDEIVVVESRTWDDGKRTVGFLDGTVERLLDSDPRVAKLKSRMPLELSGDSREAVSRSELPFFVLSLFGIATLVGALNGWLWFRRLKHRRGSSPITVPLGTVALLVVIATSKGSILTGIAGWSITRALETVILLVVFFAMEISLVALLPHWLASKLAARSR